MRFAYDLSPRQSTRLIEQARRMGIVFELQPRTVEDTQTCEGRVTQIARDHLVFELTSPPGFCNRFHSRVASNTTDSLTASATTDRSAAAPSSGTTVRCGEMPPLLIAVIS